MDSNLSNAAYVALEPSVEDLPKFEPFFTYIVQPWTKPHLWLYSVPMVGIISGLIVTILGAIKYGHNEEYIWLTVVLFSCIILVLSMLRIVIFLYQIRELRVGYNPKNEKQLLIQDQPCLLCPLWVQSKFYSESIRDLHENGLKTTSVIQAKNRHELAHGSASTNEWWIVELETQQYYHKYPIDRIKNKNRAQKLANGINQRLNKKTVYQCKAHEAFTLCPKEMACLCSC